MCVYCQTKPFGFSAASLTRRNFVASAAAMGGIYATVKVLEPVATYAQTAKADIIIENAKIVTLDAKNSARAGDRDWWRQGHRDRHAPRA